MYRTDAAPGLVYTTINAHIVALRISDGVEVWRAQIGSNPLRLHATESRLIVVGEMFVVLDALTGQRVLTLDRVQGGTLLVTGDLAFVSSAGVLHCVDLATGTLRWRNELPGTGYGPASIAVPGLVAQADHA